MSVKNRARKSGKRGELMIKRDTLDAIRRENKPTRIMYSANLSWRSLNKVVEKLIGGDLVRLELLEYHTSSGSAAKRYYLTSKGVTILNALNMATSDRVS